MKTLKCFLTVLLGAVLAVSCGNKNQGQTTYTITVDRQSIQDVAANNPGVEVLVITTDAPYWILSTPDWVTPDKKQGVGGGESTIVSLTIAPNYRNEATTTLPRSGEIKISGGNTSVTVRINQLGHTAVIDPNASIGGIPSLAEFMDFVACVNEGNSPIRWMNSNFEVELLADIDLSSVTEWTPIGNVESTGNGNNACAPKGNYFTGVFNGGNHTIRNFKTTKALAAGQTWGLFGCIYNATIKNLNVEGEVTYSATGAADAGVVVGTAYGSTIDNVKLTAKITSTEGASTGARFVVGGIVGFLYSETVEANTFDSCVKNCEVTATVNMTNGNNTGNGATGVMYGGIVGFATSVKEDTAVNLIKDCVHNGTMTANLCRCSGICSTANCGTHIEGCTNNASQVNTFENGRIGQICCNLSVRSHVKDCVNNGDLTTSGANTTTGALVALMGDDSAYIEGGDRTANTATIIGATPKYLSLLCANNNKFDHLTNVKLAGKLGLYKADGNHEMYPISPATIMDYIGYINPAYLEKVENITFVGEATETPSTGGGISDLNPVNDTWN
ncbi:MAG: BACON domain-containing protein [Bacteroidales bacterium]|nr:BACON domain-containing protein [Bacteroidales bacterium]